MKKKLLSFYFIFLLFLVTDAADHLETTNQKINLLQTEIQELQLESMKAEVTSENYLKYEFEKYVDQIEKAELLDQKIHRLQIELERLKEDQIFLEKSFERTPESSSPETPESKKTDSSEMEAGIQPQIKKVKF